ncbi:MAG: hypothetical protein GKR90_18845 [Pseudomonadales bacterium]|nr:hypothetical protein [Pseudomonadales bacterium]
MRNAISVATTAFLLCACSSPVGPIAGGKLEGTEAEWPQDWIFTDSEDNIFLETNPNDPYSVTLWGVSLDNDFFIAAVNPSSKWAENLAQDNNVVISVTGELYRGRAHPVSEVALMNRIGQRYHEKYDMEREEGETFMEDGGTLYRLSPR